MSAVRSLLENDPNMDLIVIHLDCRGAEEWHYLEPEGSDTDLANALLQNPFVTKVYFCLLGSELDEWPMLRHVFATHENLRKVVFVNESMSAAKIRPVARSKFQKAALLLHAVDFAYNW